MTRARVVVLLLLLLLVAGAGARAAAADPDRDAVLSTQPLAAITRGLTLDAEHAVASHLSIAVDGGLRGGALGDYSSTTWELGADLRWWFWPRHGIGIAGPYVAAHVSGGRTALVMSATGDGLGTSWGLEQRVDLGWRFTIRGRVALTPSLGYGAHEDIDGSGRLVATERPAKAIGFELGCLF